MFTSLMDKMINTCVQQPYMWPSEVPLCHVIHAILHCFNLALSMLSCRDLCLGVLGRY